jgi:hypothetical protein
MGAIINFPRDLLSRFEKIAANSVKLYRCGRVNSQLAQMMKTRLLLPKKGQGVYPQITQISQIRSVPAALADGSSMELLFECLTPPANAGGT